MRFSPNTILLALVSSSLIMTEVIAAPWNKFNGVKGPGIHRRSLESRQADLNTTEILGLLGILSEAIAGLTALTATVEAALDTLTDDLGLGESTDSGDDSNDAGDSNGSSDDGGDADASGNGSDNSTAI